MRKSSKHAYNGFMKKNEAIKMLGGSATQVAHAIGITPAAVAQWPEDLPPRIADRVRGVWARLNGVDFAPDRTPTEQA